MSPANVLLPLLRPLVFLQCGKSVVVLCTSLCVQSVLVTY